MNTGCSTCGLIGCSSFWSSHCSDNHLLSDASAEVKANLNFRIFLRDGDVRPPNSDFWTYKCTNLIRQVFMYQTVTKYHLNLTLELIKIIINKIKIPHTLYEIMC